MYSKTIKLIFTISCTALCAFFIVACGSSSSSTGVVFSGQVNAENGFVRSLRDHNAAPGFTVSAGGGMDVSDSRGQFRFEGFKDGFGGGDVLVKITDSDGNVTEHTLKDVPPEAKELVSRFLIKSNGDVELESSDTILGDGNSVSNPSESGDETSDDSAGDDSTSDDDSTADEDSGETDDSSGESDSTPEGDSDDTGEGDSDTSTPEETADEDVDLGVPLFPTGPVSVGNDGCGVGDFDVSSGPGDTLAINNFGSNSEFFANFIDASTFSVEDLLDILGAGSHSCFWVFAAGSTGQNVDITVSCTNPSGGACQSNGVFTNPLCGPGDAILDTEAFATCP